MTKKKSKTDSNQQFALFGVIIFLFAALIGSIFTDDVKNLFVQQQANLIPAWEKITINTNGSLELDFSEADIYQIPEKLPYIILDGNTWIPVQGEPVELIILNDKNCGQACDPTQGITTLRGNISPAIVDRSIDVSSTEGQKLQEALKIETVPTFIFNQSIEKVKALDGSPFLNNLQPGILTTFNVEGETLYKLEGQSIGLRPGKFLAPPKFADMDSEPTKGTGPIQVVEFTNYQCGYCGVLHNNIKNTLKEFIAENKITYTVKDFPAFGRNDVHAHRAANCVLREGGVDKYWEFNAKIFATQSEWSQSPDAKNFFNGLANEIGIEVNTCVDDPTIESEIQADLLEGQKFGVNGTPALFIGTQIVPGAIDANYFRTAIEAELK